MVVFIGKCFAAKWFAKATLKVSQSPNSNVISSRNGGIDF
jgi:hypothetical protein